MGVLTLTCIAALHASAQVPDKVEQYRAMLVQRPENPVLFGRLVDAWLAQGEMAGLKTYLEAKATAGGPPDWRVLAVFRDFSGDGAGAITALNEALKNVPDDPRTRLARAKALGAATRFEDALTDLAVAAKDPAVLMEAGTLRGKLLARAGRPAEAVKAWQEVITAHPADDGLREDLIELEIGEGMVDEAVAAAIDLTDKTADPYQKALRRMRVAEILAQAGRKNEAVAAYREVFAVAAESSWLEREVLARVNALFSREDDAAGLKGFYAQLRETYPRRVGVKKEAARSLLASGEGDEAVAMFREVLKVLPGDRETRNEFITLLETAGRLKESADEIAVLLATAGRDAALWEKLAGIRRTLGDEAGLKEAVDKAVALVPESEGGRVAAAAIYQRYGRPDDAQRTLRAAVKTYGLTGEAGEALAVLLANGKSPDEALGLWREMAKTADREGLLRIARSLTANGRAADAYGILASRLAGFAGDPLLLAALCQAAQFAAQAGEAVPQALEMVRQAHTPGDLETALRQAITLVSRDKEPRKWLDELTAKANPCTQELCLLAELHETFGDSIAADRDLKMAQQGGEPLLAAAQRVRLCELRGDLTAAIGATRDWLTLPGGLKTEQLKRLVNLLERSGDYAAALKETENWQRLAPGDKLASAKRAELFLTDGKPQQAVAELRRALARFGNDEEMRTKLAAAMSDAGMFAEAWRAYYGLYDEAESPAAKLKWAGLLANLAVREGREDDLVKDFKRRARDNPSSPVPLLALAEMYRSWLRPDEESQVVAEALRRKPEDVTLLQRLADLEEQGGSIEKAEVLLKKALLLQDSPDNRRRLSALWIRNGDTERGLAELLATQGGAMPRDTEKLVLPMVERKDCQSALRILAAAVPQHPDDWRLAYLHAVTLREAGKPDASFAAFAALLDAKSDLTGVTPLYPANQMQSRPGAMISDFQRFAYYRMMTKALPNGRSNRGYGSGQPAVAMPGTAADVRWMAFCQALALADISPEHRTAMLATLHSTAIPHLDFIKSVVALKPDELRAKLLAGDADPLLFRWYADAGSYDFSPIRQDTGPDLKVLRKGVDCCLKTDPDLALMLMTRLLFAGDDGLGVEGIRQMLDLIAALGVDKRAGFLEPLGRLAFDTENTLPKELRDRAEAILIADVKAQGPTAPYYQALPILWLRTGRFDEAVAWFNDLYQAGPPPTRNNPSAMAYPSRPYIYGMRQGTLTLPEVLSSLVPYQMMSEFTVREDRPVPAIKPAQQKLLDLLGEKPEPARERSGSGKPIDREALAAMLPKLNDPYLRIYLAHSLGKTNVLAREIEALEKSCAGDSKALRVVAAYHLSVNKDPAKAYQLLAAAGQAATTAAERDALDWHIYQTGLLLAAKPVAEVDLDAARRAALRLRKPLAREESTKRQLAEGLVKLGLDEESSRYTAAPVVMTGMSAFYGRTPPRQGVKQQTLALLVSQGKQEIAARRILSELRRIRPATANSNNEKQQLYEQIVSLKLTAAVVKLAPPPAGAGYQSRREYALLLSHLKQSGVALPELRALAAEKPDDAEVRSALLTALPLDERKAFVMALTDGKFDADLIGAWFVEILASGNLKIEDFLANLELLTGLTEALLPSFDPERNLSWINVIASRLGDNYQFGDVRLRSLRSTPDSSEQFDEERSRSRDTLIRRLHLAMLRHPQTCAQAFILMYASRVALETPAETLDQAALAAVALGMRLKPEPNQNPGYDGYSRAQALWVWRTASGERSSSSPPEGGLDPMSYLMRQAAEGRGANPFTPVLLDDLSKTNPEQAKSLAAFLKLVDTPGVAAFAAWRDSVKNTPDAGCGLLLTITRMAIFKHRADLLDAAMDCACELALDKQRSQYGNQPAVAEVLALLVSNQSGLTARTRVIERITRRLLGPPQAWELYADAVRDGSSNVIQIRLQVYRQFCQSFSQDAGCQVAMARFVAGNRLEAIGDSYLSDLLLPRHTTSDVAGTLKLWAEYGVLMAGPELAGKTSRGEESSLLETIYQAAERFSQQSLKELAEALVTMEGDERFWARMLGARLAKTPDVAFSELELNAAAIGKWPEPFRRNLARVILKWFPTAEKSAGKFTRSLLAETSRQALAEACTLAQGYLKNGFPADFRPDQDGRVARGMMRRLIADDPALAARIWSKALLHFDQAQITTSSGGYGNGRTARQYANSNLMSQLSNEVMPLDRLAEFISLLEKDHAGNSQGLFDSSGSGNLHRSFEDFSARGKEVFVTDKAVAGLPLADRAFAGALVALAGMTPKELLPIMAGLYLADSSNRSYSNEASRATLRDWTRKDLHPLSPDLAKVSLLALQSYHPKPFTDDEKQELQEAFASYATDVRVPAGLRFNTLHHLLQQRQSDSWIDEARCTAAFADLLVTASTPEIIMNPSESLSRFVQLKSLAPADAARLLAALKTNLDKWTRSSGSREVTLKFNLMMCVLAIRTGNAEEVTRMVRAGGVGLRGNLNLAILLWQGHHDQAAVSLLARPGEYYQGILKRLTPGDSNNQEGQLRFTREIEAALPGWLATIPDPTQRFRVECLIASAPDAAGDLAPQRPLGERLAALIGRFAAEAPQARVARDEILTAMGSDESAATPLADEYVKALGKHALAEASTLAQTYLKDGFPAGCTPGSLERDFQVMMRRLVAGDPALAAKLWSKTLLHFDQPQFAVPSNGYGNVRTARQAANASLMNLLNHDGMPLMRLTEFVYLLEKERAGNSFEFFERDGGSALYQSFRDFIEHGRKDFAADPAVAELPVAAREFAGLPVALARTTPRELLPIMAGLYLAGTSYRSYPDEPVRVTLREWTGKDLRPMSPELANVTLLVLQLYHSSAFTAAERQELREALAAFATDVRIPPGSRTCSLCYLLQKRDIYSWIDEAGCTAVTDLLAADLLAGGSASANFINSGDWLTRFAQLKSLAPADAARLLAALKTNLDKRTQRGTPDDTFRYNLMICGLAISAGNAEEVTRLVRDGGDGLRGNLNLAILLWQGHHDQAAVSLLARPGEYFLGTLKRLTRSLSNNDDGPLRFTREIEVALPGWLATIPDPTQRFRVECLIASAPDAAGTFAPQRPLGERLAALVGRFPAEAPQARMARDEILTALGSEGSAATPLADEYVTAIGKQTLAQFIAVSNNSSQTLAKREAALVTQTLIRQAMQFSFEKSGDASCMLQQFEALHAADGDQDSGAYSMMRPLAPWFAALLVRRIVELPAAERALPARQALAFARILLEWPRLSNGELEVALAVASQTAAGDATALDRWLAALPPIVRANYAKWEKGQIGSMMRTLKQPPLCGKEYDKSRRALLAALLMDCATIDRYLASEESLQYSRDLQDYLLMVGDRQNGGVFTDDDVIAAIDMIPAKHPHRAEFLVKKATLIEAHNATPEEILKVYDDAKAAAAGDAKLTDVVGCYRIKYHDNKGQHREVMVQGDNINLKNLNPKQQRIVREARTRAYANPK